MSDLAPVGTARSVARKLRIAGMEITVSSVIPQSVAAEVLDLLTKAEELLLPEKES